MKVTVNIALIIYIKKNDNPRYNFGIEKLIINYTDRYISKHFHIIETPQVISFLN